jgi:hypothetical protein
MVIDYRRKNQRQEGIVGEVAIANYSDGKISSHAETFLL